MPYPEPNIPPRPQPAPSRRPGPRAVVWGSLSLFAVLFVFLTFQLSAAAKPSGVASRPAVTANRGAGGEGAEEASTDVEEPVEPEAEAEAVPVEEEVEGEFEEFEAEPEAEFEAPPEEIPPVITSSS
jgi:hypothetical protein